MSPDHLTTQNLALRQGYGREGRPRGLVCELGLVVRSDQVSRAGDLVAACVTAGGDESRLQSASFEHSNPSALLAAAREAAYTDAEARAAQLASLAGRVLGAVERIHESEPAWPRPSRPTAESVRSAPPPMDAGSLDTSVSVTVTVTWAWAWAWA